MSQSAAAEHVLVSRRRPGILLGLVSLTLGISSATALRSRPAAAEPLFDEVAAAVGLDFFHFNGMVGRLYFPEHMGGAVALVDYDNDGDLDVYFGQGARFVEESVAAALVPPRFSEPLSDRLFRNDLLSGGSAALNVDVMRTLRFVDVTTQSGLNVATGYAMGVATGDIDNDGFVDLYVTNLGSNLLLRNVGDGTFTDITARSGADDRRWSVPASFFDYDNDGDLDLFVGNYVEFRLATHKNCASPQGASDYCGPLAYSPETNRLLRNLGSGTFEDVTASAMAGSVPGSTLGATAADFNGDGWLDLYVANDMMNNELWINHGDGRFSDEALWMGAAVDATGKPQASMGVIAADFNGDGALDLFMTHLARETNTLYLNDGHGSFADSTAMSGLGPASFSTTGFGAALEDFDGDGVNDLFVVNGAVRRNMQQVGEGRLLALEEQNQLYLGRGNGRFEEAIHESIGGGEEPAVGRGLAAGDLDNDGDVDLVISNNAGAARLLLNRSNPGSWLGVRLREGKRDAYGARARWLGAGQQGAWRRVTTDGSYAAANDPRLVFRVPALGDLSVEVEWLGGARETFPVIRRNEYQELGHGRGTPGP